MTRMMGGDRVPEGSSDECRMCAVVDHRDLMYLCNFCQASEYCGIHLGGCITTGEEKMTKTFIFYVSRSFSLRLMQCRDERKYAEARSLSCKK